MEVTGALLLDHEYDKAYRAPLFAWSRPKLHAPRSQ